MTEFLNEIILVAKREGAVLAAIVAALVAVLVAVLNPLTNWLVSRAASLREIRSTSRQRWIDEFRSDASELVGIVQGFQGYMHAAAADYQFKNRLRRDELAVRLILRLNPREEEHLSFKKTIWDLIAIYDSETAEAQHARRQRFIDEAQEITK